MIIDFHTHAFPDFLAPRAIPTLAENSGLTPYHDGTAAGLIARMDKSGIDRSVVLNIATNAHQELSVNRFAVSLLENERLIPFGSVFPGSDTWEQTLDFLAKNGIRGIKLHPDFQQFDIDAPEAQQLYAATDAWACVRIYQYLEELRLSGKYRVIRTETPENILED